MLAYPSLPPILESLRRYHSSLAGHHSHWSGAIPSHLSYPQPRISAARSVDRSAAARKFVDSHIVGIYKAMAPRLDSRACSHA